MELIFFFQVEYLAPSKGFYMPPQCAKGGRRGREAEGGERQRCTDVLFLHLGEGVRDRRVSYLGLLIGLGN